MKASLLRLRSALACALLGASCSPAAPAASSEPETAPADSAPPAASPAGQHAEGHPEDGLTSPAPGALSSQAAAPVASAPVAPTAVSAAPAAPLAPRTATQLDPARAAEQAPATFTVRFETSAGTFDMSCTRAWSPSGADRFFNLVKMGFFEGVAFFRVVTEPKPFVVQFGIHGDPEVSKRWTKSRLPAEPATRSNTRGTLSYAMAGSPDTRTTQLFFNLGDNSSLDKLGFGPICEVVGTGMDDVVSKLFAGYGGEPSAEQDRIQKQGSAFLRTKYPKLDTIRRAQIVDPPATK